jgi:hypothetical protein
VPEATWTEESWTAEAKVGDLLDALSDFPEPVRRIAGAAIRTTSPLADVVAQVLDLAGVFPGDRRAPGSHPGEHRA